MSDIHKWHNRLDLKLKAEDYLSPICGALNDTTKKAEYCSYTCPTLKERLDRGENPDEPMDVSNLDNYDQRTYGGPLKIIVEKDIR